jgi:DNA-binding MarR family transcriptional regulator
MEKMQDTIIQDFIRLTEKIANGKVNILDFGSEDMTFYRGEIHMLKMIGDDPGIFSSEMARNFNITRAVVAKTVRKLEERGFIYKQDDKKDKKRYRLFLTEKGLQAYLKHQEYHKQTDKPLFDYLDSLSGKELKTVKDFLYHANVLIEKHF